ncbi:MAG: tyrosine-protein phosphatase [Chloroflexota bacterium]
MKKWIGVTLGAVGAVAGLAAFINRRNQFEHVDPQSLITRLPDDLPGRIMDVDGVINFRDMGGYHTADGQRVRTGLLYRAGALGDITEKGMETLQALGIKLICDLRSEEEEVAAPDKLPQNPAPIYAHLPLLAEDNRRERVITLFFNRRKFTTMMPDMYTRVIIDGNAHLYGDILRRIANADNLPTLIHCTAGKDRTGVAAMLILSLLGVPEDVILADYSLSNLYYDSYLKFGTLAIGSIAWTGVKAEDLQPLFVSHPDTLKAAIAHIHRKYGSVENYLRSAAGVNDEIQQKIKINLLEN